MSGDPATGCLSRAGLRCPYSRRQALAYAMKAKLGIPPRSIVLLLLFDGALPKSNALAGRHICREPSVADRLRNVCALTTVGRL